MKWYKVFFDGNGNPSSKRLTGFCLLFLVVVFGMKGANNYPVNMEMFWGVLGGCLTMAGIVLSENYMNRNGNGNGKHEGAGKGQ